MHNKQEILCFVFPKVLIFILFSPIFSNVVVVIGSKHIGVSSTFPIKLELSSVIKSKLSFIDWYKKALKFSKKYFGKDCVIFVTFLIE